jgi:hypothetical protein
MHNILRESNKVKMTYNIEIIQFCWTKLRLITILLV